MRFENFFFCWTCAKFVSSFHVLVDIEPKSISTYSYCNATWWLTTKLKKKLQNKQVSLLPVASYPTISPKTSYLLDLIFTCRNEYVCIVMYARTLLTLIWRTTGTVGQLLWARDSCTTFEKVKLSCMSLTIHLTDTDSYHTTREERCWMLISCSIRPEEL